MVLCPPFHRLASGAAGEVFQARWRKRRVAVKVLRSAMVEGDPEVLAHTHTLNTHTERHFPSIHLLILLTLCRQMLNEFAKEVHTLRTVRHEHIVDFFWRRSAQRLARSLHGY